MKRKSLNSNRQNHFKTLLNFEKREALLNALKKISGNIIIDANNISLKTIFNIDVIYEFIKELEEHQKRPYDSLINKKTKEVSSYLIEEILKNNYRGTDIDSLKVRISVSLEYIQKIILLIMKEGQLSDDLMSRYKKELDVFQTTFDYADLYNEKCEEIVNNFYQIIDDL